MFSDCDDTHMKLAFRIAAWHFGLQLTAVAKAVAMVKSEGMKKEGISYAVKKEATDALNEKIRKFVDKLEKDIKVMLIKNNAAYSTIRQETIIHINNKSGEYRGA